MGTFETTSEAGGSAGAAVSVRVVLVPAPDALMVLLSQSSQRPTNITISETSSTAAALTPALYANF